MNIIFNHNIHDNNFKKIIIAITISTAIIIIKIIIIFIVMITTVRNDVPFSPLSSV